jgi:hypothetical protein
MRDPAPQIDVGSAIPDTIMPRRSAVLITLGVFAVAFAVYVLSPITTSYDSRWTLHTAMSIAHGQGGDLSAYRKALERDKFYAIEYPDGRPRTQYPIGPALLVLPAAVVASWVYPSFSQRLQDGGADRVEKLFASIIGAAAVAAFFWLIHGQFGSLWIAGGSTFIFAFCTSMWSTVTRALWQHGPLVLMLLIAMLLLQCARRRPALVQYVSLPLAFAFLNRPTAVVPIIVISGYVAIYHRQWLIRYLCWAALIAIPWLAYNFSVYGGPFPNYYLHNYSGQRDFVHGLLANLVSPSRGLLVFSPVLILSVSGFVLAMRQREQRALFLAYGLIVVLMLAIVAGAPIWWAGASFGPRFTADLLPFLGFFTAFNFAYFATLGRRERAACVSITAAMAVISFLMHSQGATRSGPMAWNAVPNSIDEHPERAWDWRDPQFLRGVFR